MCLFAGLGFSWLFGAPRAHAACSQVKNGSQGAGAAELRVRAGTCDFTGPARAGRPEGRRTDSRVPERPRELTQKAEKGEADSVPKS